MKKFALYGLVLGTAMAVSTAQAEPLTLTADQMDHVTASGVGFVDFSVNITKFKDLDTRIDFDKDANVDVDVDIDGFLADAEAAANCFGIGCTAETFTGAETDALGVTNEFGAPGAVSVSQSVAASNEFEF
jgi:hypothetical protein